MCGIRQYKIPVITDLYTRHNIVSDATHIRMSVSSHTYSYMCGIRQALTDTSLIHWHMWLSQVTLTVIRVASDMHMWLDHLICKLTNYEVVKSRSHVWLKLFTLTYMWVHSHVCEYTHICVSVTWSSHICDLTNYVSVKAHPHMTQVLHTHIHVSVTWISHICDLTSYEVLRSRSHIWHVLHTHSHTCECDLTHSHMWLD